MIITQITGVNKSRYRVYLDGQFAFVVYKGELGRFRLAEGKEIEEESYRCIMEEILPKRAKLRCMNLLQSRDYTEKQLEEKLRQGEYPAQCIDEAVSYVKSYGYINDRNYAKTYIEYHIEDRSKARIETDLLRKGISKELIRDVFEELKESGIEQNETDMISALLQKKGYQAGNATVDERQKMYGFLFRKGFSADAITKALA